MRPNIPFGYGYGSRVRARSFTEMSDILSGWLSKHCKPFINGAADVIVSVVVDEAFCRPASFDVNSVAQAREELFEIIGTILDKLCVFIRTTYSMEPLNETPRDVLTSMYHAARVSRLQVSEVIITPGLEFKYSFAYAKTHPLAYLLVERLLPYLKNTSFENDTVTMDALRIDNDDENI